MYKNMTKGLIAASGAAVLPQLGGAGDMVSNGISIVFGVLFLALAITQASVIVKSKAKGAI